MRVITTIPHSDFAITLFAWNGKYILKFEQGNFEQTFKISEMDTTGDEEVKAVVGDTAFIQKIATRFEDMREDWYKLF